MDGVQNYESYNMFLENLTDIEFDGNAFTVL
jgi:hypothetical protein